MQSKLSEKEEAMGEMRQSGMEGPRSQRPLRPGRGLDLEDGDYCRRVSGRGGHSQICELLSED